MRLISILLFISLMTCCKNPTIDNQVSISNGSWTDSIEYYYERDQIAGLKFQDSLLGLMGFPNIDKYRLVDLDDRVYRLTMQQAIGAITAVIEISCDSNNHLLKFSLFKFDNDCNPVTSNRKLAPDCFIKQEQYEKVLTTIECDSINSLLIKEEVFDLKGISQKNRDAIILDGEAWRLDIRYMIHDERTRSNFVRTHTVYRFLPEDFNSLYTVGNYIKSLSIK